jgi:hypothetical protein
MEDFVEMHFDDLSEHFDQLLPAKAGSVLERVVKLTSPKA